MESDAVLARREAGDAEDKVISADDVLEKPSELSWAVRIPFEKGFETTRPYAWSAGSDIGVALNKLQEASEPLAAKKDGADARLLKEKDWSGLQARVRVNAPMKMTLCPDVEFNELGKDGYDGWLFSVRKNTPRVGAHAYPAPLLPAVVQCLTEPVYVLQAPASALLARGFSLHDFFNSLVAQNGNCFIALECTLMRLLKGQVTYQPAGWISLWMFLTENDKSPGWAHMYHVPIMNAALAEHLEDNVKQAMKTYSEAFYIAESLKLPAFSKRWAAMKTFFQEIGVAAEKPG